MLVLGSTDVAKRVASGRSGGARRGPLATALTALLVLCCVLGLAATASAAPPDISDQASPARLALGQAELYAWDAGAGEWLGYSVAVSGDTALVGAPFHDTPGGGRAGAAYVFTRSGGVWTEPVQLVAGDGEGADQFGVSVSLAGDTALVGATQHDTGGKTSAGAAYVFTRSGGSWMQEAQLAAADGAVHGFFGRSVSLSGDAALIGATGQAAGGEESAGAAYVFTRSGAVWTQQQRLAASDPATGAQFGSSVAISGDTALVGAPFHEAEGAAYVGAAYVFTRSGGVWTQQQTLTASDPAAHDQFGGAVSVFGDTALVGAINHDSGGTENAGAAYVFTRSAGAWTQQATLVAADGAAQDGFGSAVALSGERALVGACFRGTAGMQNAGAAYVFTRSAGAWTQQATLAAADGAAKDWFGFSVAISGETALVGAPFHNTAGKRGAGSAYVFLTAPTVFGFTPASGPVASSVTITGIGFADAVAVAFNGVPAVFQVGSDALITATVPAGATTGLIAVTTPGGTGSSVASFTVIPAPAIAKLTPAAGKRGATVTVTGTGFGATRDRSSVKFGATRCATYLSWSDTRIRCKVPAKAKYGTVKVMVTTAGGVSNARSFEVKR